MEKDDKQIEGVINKLMSADALEQPSLDFTDRIMSKVEAISHSTAIVYKPLISKTVWLFIIAGFVGLIAYIMFNEPSASKSWLERFNLSNVTNPLENITFNFSKALMYAMVLLTLMLAVQIPLLKHYLDKRLAF